MKNIGIARFERGGAKKSGARFPRFWKKRSTRPPLPIKKTLDPSFRSSPCINNFLESITTIPSTIFHSPLPFFFHQFHFHSRARHFINKIHVYVRSRHRHFTWDVEWWRVHVTSPLRSIIINNARWDREIIMIIRIRN